VAELNTWGGHPRRTKTRNLVLGGISLFVAASLVGTVLGWLTTDPANAGFPGIKSSTPAAPNTDPANLPEPTPIETPSASVSTWTPSPTASESIKAERERQAYNDLEQQADDDLQQTTLAGQWVAQLSSKYVGVRDPLQQTESGSHRFFAVDILAEHQDLRARYGNQFELRLLRGQDFGSGLTYNGETLWYTFLLGDFKSRSAVKSFCRSAFPGLAGRHLENRCLPRTLRP
jgi:hypothetical protein